MELAKLKKQWVVAGSQLDQLSGHIKTVIEKWEGMDRETGILRRYIGWLNEANRVYEKLGAIITEFETEQITDPGMNELLKKAINNLAIQAKECLNDVQEIEAR